MPMTSKIQQDLQKQYNDEEENSEDCDYNYNHKKCTVYIIHCILFYFNVVRLYSQ